MLDTDGGRTVDETFFADALDTAALPGPWGWTKAACRSFRPFRIDAAGEQAMAACGDLARDAVIAVPASGSSAVVGEARRRSAFVIAIASPGCAFALRHAGQSS